MRAYAHHPNSFSGGSTTQEFSSFAATSNGGAGARRRLPRSGLSSLADEFGEDPVAMMSRATATATAHSGEGDLDSQVDKDKDDDGHRSKVVAEFLGQMRRGLERGDRSDYDDGMTRTSVSGSELDEEKKRQTMGTVGTTDVESARDRDGHDWNESIAEVERPVGSTSKESAAPLDRGGSPA